jgi:ribosomal protein S18 acetylase RimI-like enzyme
LLLQQSITIRAFESADQQAARSLILTGLGEHFGFIDETLNPDIDDIQRQYIDQGFTFVVVELGADLVGTGALIAESDEDSRMVRVSITSTCRRMGIGRRVVEHLVNVARQRGFARVLVETNNDWWDAIGLYRACGFTQYARDDESVYLSLEL